ncbi:ferritin-like domain-containing protein [Paenibacillus roseipurpureus]|uniref:Ferritin-like domain-containing protein n=1 Tax=Paenibacillus roseopurpureus TaxID=2918901 RepID=A0AA96RL73_9BACL|nr:ferritin-like domain-containing protein [Paenibacillus sp. MBLB1832]WNR45094.1 ferritin-like domain-containing protein [Paenibacillus sp. MBLB1832]
MYWTYPYDYRNTFQPIWQVGYQQALDLIQTSVQDERNDELFYEELIKLAPSPEQAAIITSIRNDERSHNAMFRAMYREMTGHEVYGVSDEQYSPVRTYSEGIQKALQGELSAVEKYRKIWFGLPYGIYKDTVYGIILDELKHASKYNYLFALNR